MQMQQKQMQQEIVETFVTNSPTFDHVNIAR